MQCSDDSDTTTLGSVDSTSNCGPGPQSNESPVLPSAEPPSDDDVALASVLVSTTVVPSVVAEDDMPLSPSTPADCGLQPMGTDASSTRS